ncbi:universal stress protein [Aphanothece hegewaldii CCALA 016]|uniref:Universal stress protein n=1 Tax=Aphanothece hegewaldii CCALA 016 TaxID=2107694 RepID=A0A2T1LRW4_9CHRO|nr:universal stress protein [Aphanothece hegewaldii]PSF31430.1 universal stress protein [Aphanothece hegewaldii CCALA 016]
MLETILVALDCSEMSEDILDAIGDLYITATTKIILAHVLPSPETGQDTDAAQPHQSLELLYQKADEHLKDLQQELKGSIIEIVNGDPAEEIIRLANIYQADLVIIGTRGLQGVDRIIEDSVSSQVVCDAPCSVLVIKP